MVVQNAFQILLTGEVTKSSIFYEDVVIVYINPGGCHRDRDRMVVGFTTTCTIFPSTTNVGLSNPVHGEVYSIPHKVIQFVR